MTPQTPTRETDELRLADLADRHRLPYLRERSTYVFEDFTAYGLRQALGYVEGYDRAMSRRRPRKDERPEPFRHYYLTIHSLLNESNPKETAYREWFKRRLVQVSRSLAAQSDDELRHNMLKAKQE